MLWILIKKIIRIRNQYHGRTIPVGWKWTDVDGWFAIVQDAYELRYFQINNEESDEEEEDNE